MFKLQVQVEAIHFMENTRKTFSLNPESEMCTQSLSLNTLSPLCDYLLLQLFLALFHEFLKTLLAEALSVGEDL